MNTQHMKIEQILTKRAQRRKDIKDGKRAAYIIIILLLAVMAIGASSCASRRTGCWMSQGMSGTH